MEKEINNSYDLTAESLEELTSMSKWLRYLGISGFIYIACLILTVIGTMIYSNTFEDVPIGFVALIAGFIAIIVGLYGYLSNLIKKSGDKINQAMEEDSPEVLEEGLETLAKGFKFTGWYFIVAMGLVVVSIILVPVVFALIIGF